MALCCECVMVAEWLGITAASSKFLGGLGGHSTD